MSFPRYPKYKDSGVEWLGEVPEHWEMKRLKFLCDIQTGDKDTENAVEDGIYPFFVRSQTVERINSCTFDCEAVLTAGDGVGVGKVFHYHNGPFDFHQRVYMLNKFRKASGPFLFQFLRENFYKVALEGGAKSTVDSLRRPLFTNFPVALPSAEEQRSIVAFVERESTKIDELVAEQRRLMELLKEKRQAVISHAVTRGLNPAAPLKPSGIEWLGDVPAHWTVAAVRRIIQRIEQGWSPDCFGRPAEPEEWGVLKSGCVNRGVFVEQENKALPDTLEPIPEYEIRAGDVLMSRASGSPELVGSTAYLHETRAKLMLSDKTFRIHLQSQMDRRFFVAVFNSRMMRSQIERAISGADGLANNLPQSAMKTFFCAVPPIDEQQAIVAHLDMELAKLDTLTAEAQRAIDLLQERRTALISAAVTGQIDVRNNVASELAKRVSFAST